MNKRIGYRTTIYRQRIVVEGMGSFPLDMLRYDNCIPAQEEEIHKLVMSSKDMPEYRERRQIELIRHAYNGEPPTNGRWQSFGWRVVSVYSG